MPGFDDVEPDGLRIVDVEYAFDLSQQSRKETLVSARNPNQSRDQFRREGALRQADADGCPVPFQEQLHLLRRQCGLNS